MIRVMILGANGMAGHMISLYFKTLNDYYVIDICHSTKLDENSILLDVKNKCKVEELIDNIKPDIIINCVGVLNRVADEKISDTIFINSYFPRKIEDYCKDRNVKIIHLSTDCVFSGTDGKYTEDSNPDGKDIYAKTKILGEIVNNKDLTVRTSIIGPELKLDGIGLFHWFMNQTGSVKGYSNVIWSGVTTLQLAICLDKMIKANITGLYNLAPKQPINKYQLLKLISEIFNKDMKIEEDTKFRSDKSLVTLRKDFQYNIPSYRTMIIELREWMLQNRNFYTEYL